MGCGDGVFAPLETKVGWSEIRGTSNAGDLNRERQAPFRNPREGRPFVAWLICGDPRGPLRAADCPDFRIAS